MIYVLIDTTKITLKCFVKVAVIMTASNVLVMEHAPSAIILQNTDSLII